METINPECQRIKDMLIRAYEGDSWHGPAVKKVVADIDLNLAASRLPGSHNIIELVGHIVVWRQFVIARLEGNDAYDVMADENWTHVSNLQTLAWMEALEKLENCQQRLVALLDQFPDERLNEPVASRSYNYYILLHGIIQHDLFHLGQIALLKKPQLSIIRSRPGKAV